LAEFGFDEPGEGEVEVIAAEEQVFADGGAGEFDEVAGAGDFDESEVAGAAADVADENGLAVEELFLGGGEVVGDPGVEGGGGLFDEGDAVEAGLGGGVSSRASSSNEAGTVRTMSWAASGVSG